MGEQSHRLLTAAVTVLALVVAACSSTEPAPQAASEPAAPATSEPAESDLPDPPSAAPDATPTEGAPAPTGEATGEPPADLPTTTPQRLQRVSLRAQPLARLDGATAMATRPGDAALYVTRRRGAVFRVVGRKATKILDWSAHVESGGERGMLGLTFSPDGKRMYAYYIGLRDRDSHLDEWTMKGNRPDPRSRRQILLVDQPDRADATVHKGGNIAFGPDGMLYLALGDGGPAGDPPDTSQDMGTLLGKMVRIRVVPGSRGYRVPPDNPFLGAQGARPEILSLGLRNPWRWSFDAKNGDLYLADVGRYAVEEINFLPRNGLGGANFGWNLMEGTRRLGGAPPEDHVPPLHEYPHTDRCAVIGGFVYRGDAIPDLHGAYVYGDYCDGKVRALVRGQGAVTADVELGVAIPTLSSFGQGPDGELYAMSIEDGLLKLVAGG